MELLIANQVGRIRYAKLGGRDYIVAPLSMLVPGVLPGSKGPLYYPPDVVNRNPSAWNNIPIVVNHPFGLDGPTSARDPEVLNKQGIGFVFKARKNGRAEGWFDVENTKRIEPRIYKSLITNTPIELSTGLYTKHKARAGNYKGKPFDAVVVNMEPDHLAVLMDQTGACSLKDGCGVLINQNGNKPMPSLLERLANLFTTNKEQEEVEEEEVVENEALTLEEDEIVELVTNGWITTKTGVHIFIGAGGTIEKGPKGLVGKKVPGGGGGSAKGKADTDEETDDSNQFLSSTGKVAPGTLVKVADTATSKKASQKLSTPHRMAGTEGEVVEHIPELGTVKIKTKEGNVFPIDHKKVHTVSKAGAKPNSHEYQQQMEHHLSKQQETALAAVAAQKAGNKPLAKALASQSESHANEIYVLKSKIDDLKPNMGEKIKTTGSNPESIGNVDAAKAMNKLMKAKSRYGEYHPKTQKARKELEAARKSSEKGMTQNQEGSQFGKPQTLKKEKPNMAKQKIVVNEDVDELTDEDREELVEAIVGNCNCHADDKLVLMSLSDETLATLAAKGITANSGSMAPGKKAAPKKRMMTQEEHDAMMAEEEATEDEEEPVTNSKKGKAKKVTTNSKPKLDAETEMLVNYAKEKMQEERSELVEKLVANAEEDDVEELTETYNSLSIPQLKLMVKALPKEEKQEVKPTTINRQLDSRQIMQQRRNYAGAAGAVVPSHQQRKAMTNNGKPSEPDFDDQPLEPPTINHAEIAGFENGRFKSLSN